jgi:hypothetical protein
LDVFNCCQFVPDLPALHVLDPGRRQEDRYNQAGYMLALPLPRGAATRFESPKPFVKECAIDPMDPGLGALGIRYFAFDVRIDTKLIPVRFLRRMVDHPVDGFWLYAAPGG